MATTSIDVLLNSGFDAFTNLYDVSIIGFNITDENGAYNIRARDFKPPTIALEEYETHYKTISVKSLKPQFTDTREFSLKFRIDNNWVLYEALKKWKLQYVQIANDSVSPNIVGEENYTITVSPYKSSSTGYGIGLDKWIFKNVILYDLIEPTFQRREANPIEIECKFLFGNFQRSTQ